MRGWGGGGGGGFPKNAKDSEWSETGAVLGGGSGGWRMLFLQRIDHLPTHMVPHCTILRYIFLADRPKIFLTAPLPQNKLTLRGGGGAKKRKFFVQIFPKNAKKNLFCGLFSKILPAAQQFWPKQGLFRDLGELGKPIWSK